MTEASRDISAGGVCPLVSCGHLNNQFSSQSLSGGWSLRQFIVKTREGEGWGLMDYQNPWITVALPLVLRWGGGAVQA